MWSSSGPHFRVHNLDPKMGSTIGEFRCCPQMFCKQICDPSAWTWMSTHLFLSVRPKAACYCRGPSIAAWSFFGPVLGAIMKQVCWHSRKTEDICPMWDLNFKAQVVWGQVGEDKGCVWAKLCVTKCVWESCVKRCVITSCVCVCKLCEDKLVRRRGEAVEGGGGIQNHKNPTQRFLWQLHWLRLQWPPPWMDSNLLPSPVLRLCARLAIPFHCNKSYYF